MFRINKDDAYRSLFSPSNNRNSPSLMYEDLQETFMKKFGATSVVKTWYEDQDKFTEEKFSVDLAKALGVGRTKGDETKEVVEYTDEPEVAVEITSHLVPLIQVGPESILRVKSVLVKLGQEHANLLKSAEVAREEALSTYHRMNQAIDPSGAMTRIGQNLIDEATKN